MNRNNENIQMLFTKWVDSIYDSLWDQFVQFSDLPEHMMQGMERDFDEFCWDWFNENADIHFGIEDDEGDIVVDGCNTLQQAESMNEEMQGKIVAFDDEQKFYFYNSK